MSELESKIQRRCQRILKEGGAFTFKTHGDMYSRVGIPDLVSCVPVTEDVLKKMLDEGWFKNRKIGVFVGIECKQIDKLEIFDDRRRAQEIVGREIKNAGGIWFTVGDSDVVEALIKTMKGEI